MSLDRLTGANQSCHDCYFYESTGVNQGICRRYPPTVQQIPKRVSTLPGQDAIQMAKLSTYPPVNGEDRGCGEYSRAETIEPPALHGGV